MYELAFVKGFVPDLQLLTCRVGCPRLSQAGSGLFFISVDSVFYWDKRHCVFCVCLQPDCHLHLHLRWADNPYVSGTVHTKDSAPGLIMGAGQSHHRAQWTSS